MRDANRRISDKFAPGGIASEWALAGCAGKRSFDTPQLASHVARRGKIRFEFYRCKCCGKYHLAGRK